MKRIFLLSSLILLVFLFLRVKAFLPRINVGVGESTSFDHALITKRGFLKPLIYFFRDNPQYLKDQYLTSFLLDILSSDSPDALEETVDNITPQIKFLNALSTILSANAEVDSFPLSRLASAHFDGEQFRQGNARLIQLRQELITSLLQGDKLQHARNLAGTALHTLQDFYSHSNWIELGNSGPYEVLGKPGSEIPQEYIAGPTEATCENCEPGTLCESNLITLKLTSGYRSGQDVMKPENVGKCSYGGTMDESRLKPATGGINKHTATTIESPHASLHKIAADLAAEATSIFLSDIRATVGDDIFAKFLNLKSENSMALVIDVSGSMSDEISEVKNLSINFVQKTLEKKGSSFTYILVPFSDPEVGPVTVTSDAKTVIEAVNNLTASGGGDCPELGMTGLYQALLHCLPETNIYYFSDADVKDENRENEVLSLAKKKKVKINLILSGQCSRRRRRNVPQSESFKEFRRIRRSVQGQALYQSVASQTGGQVFQASKSEVADLVEIIDPGSPVNSSVDLQEVGLLNIEESRAQSVSGQSYFVDIDNTLQSLVLVLTAAGSPSLDIQIVEANTTLQEKIITSSNRLLILEVSSLVSGLLNTTVSCVGPYTLQVTGFSPLDFTYQLLDVEDLERGITRRVVGNPLRGQTLWLTLDFVGRKEIERVSFLTLVDLNGTDLETFNITQGQGLYKNTYFATFVPSAEKFRLKVTGTDKTGAQFQRGKPTLFTLGDIKLSQNVDNINGSNSIFPGEPLEVEIDVQNSGDTQKLYFKASDDLQYFTSINPLQGTLGKNDTLVLRITLLAPSNARYGVTSTVTVFASQNSDHTQVVNFMVFFVTVASKFPDVSPPSCSVTNQTGTCASVYGRPECVSSTWYAHVMFIDAGEGMFSITTRDNENGTLNADAFNQGAVNNSISASFTSDCCNPRVLFVGLDLVGNMGTCSISLVPDIVSLRAEPNNTAVSLYPGNTIKVPFTLLNLGSKGSFSFEVTKAPTLISYVMPFSLVLKANASTAGQVVIKSLGGVRKPQNLTVKAVMQPGTIHERKVALFSIQVALSRYKDPDLLPPSCTIINQTRNCNNAHDRSKCIFSTWHVHVIFTDTGEGLASITTQGNDNGTLRVDAFNQGAVNTSITASFTSICCHPRVLFVGLDLVGNKGTCSISLVPDIVSLRANPRNTAVSLYPGKTTKVPFTLLNLGSAGSFSFQVTKAPKLITCVIPFSLALESNVSAAGYLMIKSLSEANEMQNLTLTAISQSNSASVKEVTLVQIKVLVLKHVRLEVVAPNDSYSLSPGQKLQINFTIKNLASSETFTFLVHSNQSSIDGSIQPSPVRLGTMQSSSCILTLAARLDADENTIALLNVTTAPASPNADQKELEVFSLTVAVGGRVPSATENSLENGTKLETWHIVLIFLSSSVALLLLFLIILLLVHKWKHGSYFSKKPVKGHTNPGYASSQLRLENLEVIVYNHP